MWQCFRKSGKNECSGTRGMLSGYMDRRLSPEEVARVEEHLGACQGCREELESLRATVALVRRLPEVTLSRSFAVAPVRTLPGRRTLPALRYATAGAVLLLVLTFAVDGAGLFEESGPSDQYWGPAASEADADHWLVSGERNDIVDSENVTKTKVSLVVPDGSDNASAAVSSLASDGVIYGTFESVPGGVLQLVLTEAENKTADQGDVIEFAVLPGADGDESPFTPSGPEDPSALDAIVKKQEGEFLNVVPANSDNTVLYAFDLGDSIPAEARSVPEGDAGTRGWNAVLGSSDGPRWLCLLEYSLIGLVAALGGAAVALWLRRRRAGAEEARIGKA